MTDIAIGGALWNDLVRQVAIRTRNYDDAEDLPHTACLRLVHSRAQTPVDDVAAFLARTAINANSDNRRHSRAIKNVAIAQRFEAFEAVNAIWKSASALPANCALKRLFCSRPSE